MDNAGILILAWFTCIQQRSDVMNTLCVDNFL